MIVIFATEEEVRHLFNIPLRVYVFSPRMYSFVVTHFVLTFVPLSTL